MIRLHRSVIPAQGKWREAVQFVSEMGAVVNEIDPEANVQTMLTKYGDTGLHWFADADSVGGLDELMDRVEADPRYKEVIARSAGQGLFVAGSERTVIYKTTQA